MSEATKTTLNPAQLDQLSINTIRFLSVDMVQKANSGHPGLPLGAAPMAYVLWTRWLKYNPHNPHWLNRDRFVLSAGHGSALPRPAGIKALAETCLFRRAAATLAVGQHRHQGSSSPRRSLRRSAGGSGHHQHHPREDAA